MRVIVCLAVALVAAPAVAAPCHARIAFVQDVIDRDLKTGFVGKPVHDQMTADLAKAAATCEAGQEKQAQGEIDATQRRHGYPVR